MNKRSFISGENFIYKLLLEESDSSPELRESLVV